MEIKRFEGTGRMSRAVIYNKTVYLCGQTSGAEDKDIKIQTKETLDKVEELLLKYGSDKKHILSCTLYIKDMSLFEDMNEVWDKWVEDGFEPARACVQAKMARECILFEISVVAAQK
jgi:enamine deaminase RidA (YjgF/YER057c/UK114 family)